MSNNDDDHHHRTVRCKRGKTIAIASLSHCSVNIDCLGWLKLKLQSQLKWHRRYCTIDWNKASLFIANKYEGHTRDWIKLLPNVVIQEGDLSTVSSIEIKLDSTYETSW
jgi:hypothetical protein